MEYRVEYSTRFIRAFRRLSNPLQEEVVERVEMLKDSSNHARLRVHKLSGNLKGISSFSVNYRIRITFSAHKKTLVLETVGTHDELY